MIILYTFYFSANYNLSTAAKTIQDEFMFSSSQFGILFTVFTITFACGHFIAGFLGDRYSPKKMMIIGALGAVCSNFLFGFSNTLLMFGIFWGMNALFLSMGWSPGCSILFKWFPEKRLGFFMGIYNAFSFLGGVIVFPLAAFSISRWGWRAAFFIPPLLLLAWLLVFVINVKDKPEDAGYTAEWRKETESEQITITGKDYLNVLMNPTMNLIYLAAICSQFVRWGLVNWVVKIFSEPINAGGYGMTLVFSATIASLIHWGGAFFSILLGYASDKVFKGKRWQTIFIGYIASAVSLFLMFVLGADIVNMPGGVVLLGGLLLVAGGCIQGLQAPIFNLPGDILGNKLGGTGVGITNGWSYIGASLSGVALGSLLDVYGFMSGILLMGIVSLVGAGIILLVKR